MEPKMAPSLPRETHSGTVWKGGDLVLPHPCLTTPELINLVALDPD